MSVLYTYWEHGSKDTAEEETVIDALKRAHYDVEYNSAHPESIMLPSGKVLDEKMIDAWWEKHREMEREGYFRERLRLLGLRSITSRPVTWREISALLRKLRWKPSIVRIRGCAVLVGITGGRVQRIASCANIGRMTPADFWKRFKGLNTYQVAEFERL